MRIVLGVSGGIAAYKAAEIARALIQNGHEVQAVLTRAAEEFIRPLTFASLTGRKVITELFSSASPEATHSSRGGAYRRRAGTRSAAGRARHGQRARRNSRTASRTIFFPHFIWRFGARGPRAGHEQQHVGARSDARQRRNAAAARAYDSRTGRAVFWRAARSARVVWRKKRQDCGSRRRASKPALRILRARRF